MLLNETGATGKYDVSASTLMHSDDGGLTWTVGEVLKKGTRFHQDTKPSENTVVELKHG